MGRAYLRFQYLVHTELNLCIQWREGDADASHSVRDTGGIMVDSGLQLVECFELLHFQSKINCIVIILCVSINCYSPSILL